MAVDNVGSDDIHSDGFLPDRPITFECGRDWNGRSVSEAQDAQELPYIVKFILESIFGNSSTSPTITDIPAEEKTFTIVSCSYAGDYVPGSTHNRPDASRYNPPKGYDYTGSKTNPSSTSYNTPSYNFTYPGLNPNDRFYIPPSNYSMTNTFSSAPPLTVAPPMTSPFNNPFLPTINQFQSPMNVPSRTSAPQNYNPPKYQATMPDLPSYPPIAEFPMKTSSPSLNTPIFGPTLETASNFKIPSTQSTTAFLTPSESSLLTSQALHHPSVYNTSTLNIPPSYPLNSSTSYPAHSSPALVAAPKQTMDIPTSGSPTLSFLQGVKTGATKSVKEIPSTLSTVVKMAGTHILEPIIHPLNHILPGQELISTAVALPETISQLSSLEKGTIPKAISPEGYKLFSEWSTLSPQDRSNLTGQCVGKHGTDLLLPAAAVKGAKTVVNLVKVEAATGAVFKEAAAIGKLENSAGSFGTLPSNFASEINAIKIRELLKTGRNIPVIAKDLGFSGHEIAQLTKTGNLNSTVASTFETIVSDKAMLQSLEKFKNAETFLKPYRGQYVFETQAKELIQQTGVKTFPKPKGIPENFKITISDKGAGITYIHPENTHISVRVMPGKPHSPNPHQRTPYVIHMKDGQAFDKSGKMVNKKAPEAHIPIDEFVFRKD